MARWELLFLCAFAIGAALLVPSAAAQSAKQSAVESVFVRGVYWPWERLDFVAKNAGLEKWTFADRLLASLRKDFHCNLVWIVNIGLDDAAKMCDLAEKHGILILPNINPFLSMTYNGFTRIADVEAAAKEAARVLGGKKALGAYVLRDEPRSWHAAQMEEFRRAMLKADPTRPSIVVSMNLDTETYIRKTGFPIVCTDNYPFGGDRSPNIPSTVASSQSYYRGVVSAHARESIKAGKRMWVMPQIFADAWGPWWFDTKGCMVIEPGSYYHWRMPTVAETNWQIWEGVRTGCTGVAFYVLFGSGNTWDGAAPVPERMARQAEAVRKNGWPLVAKRLETGAGDGMLFPNGEPTPQMRAMGETFGVLKTLEPVLLDMSPAPFPAVFAAKPFTVNTFAASDGTRYAVVVNDDVKTAREESLHFLPHTAKVEVASGGGTLALGAEPVGGLLAAPLKLPPGGGAVLKLSYGGKDPGLLLFEEDFSTATLGVKLERLVRQPVRRAFGAGWEWIVQKEKDAPPDAKGVIAIENISKPGGATGGVLTSPKTQLAVYCAVEGNFSAPESLVVAAVGADGKERWLQSNTYHLPVRVEQGTDRLRIELADKVSVNRILLWAVPLTPPD